MDQTASCKGNKNYPELNESKNTAYQNLQDAAKVILTRKFITQNIHHKKEGLKSIVLDSTSRYHNKSKINPKQEGHTR